MNIDATIAVGFLIVFVLVNIAGALFFHLAEDVTEPGYGSPTPNGGPYRPSSLHHRHSWRYRPGDRTVSPPRRNPLPRVHHPGQRGYRIRPGLIALRPMVHHHAHGNTYGIQALGPSVNCTQRAL